MRIKKGTPALRSPRSARKASEQRATRKQNPTFLKRLLFLISQHGGSKTAFAKRIGVSTAHVSKWCNDGMTPGGDKLFTIATQTGVSVDWLLGFDVPQYRGEDRALNDLEADLAHFVARNVAEGLSGEHGHYEGEMIEVDASRLLAECIARGIEACANHRTALLAYTDLAYSVTGASADLFVLGEALASTLDADLQAGLGRAVAEQRKVQEQASVQLAQLSAIVGGSSPVGWSPYALWPEVTRPTPHVLNWMSEADADARRQNSTDSFLRAAGQPTASEMARQLSAKQKHRG